MSSRFFSLGVILLLFVALVCLSCRGETAPRDRISIIPLTPIPPGQQGPTAVSSPVRGPRHVSLDYLVREVTVPPLPTAFAFPIPNDNLQRFLREAVKGQPGLSVVIENLRDGRSAFINADQVHFAGALFHLSVLYEAFRQKEAGQLDFARVLKMEEKYARYSQGSLELLEMRAGDTYRVRDALNAMIVVSDTPSALLLKELTGSRQDETLKMLGLTSTSFNDDNQPTTARDITRLLKAIARAEGVASDSRQQMLALLMQEAVRDGIPALLPLDTRVAHK
ncbi:MAG TPA: serine hydrolase, partial [Dehalococcoidia bacterium]|nr:serine hydrolase [Dehalococcoidia bacterium]